MASKSEVQRLAVYEAIVEGQSENDLATPIREAIYGAIVLREPREARALIFMIAHCIRLQIAMPLAVRRYASEALLSIYRGKDAAQALRLKANARHQTPFEDLQRLWCRCELHRLQGKTGSALNAVAREEGLTVEQAKQRLRRAREVVYPRVQEMYADLCKLNPPESSWLRDLGHKSGPTQAHKQYFSWLHEMVGDPIPKRPTRPKQSRRGKKTTA